MNKHLSEIEIQDYVLQQMKSETHIAGHLQTCSHCKLRVEEYQLLFNAIKAQPEPAFDFDLSAIVLSEIAPSEKKMSWEVSFAWFFAIAGSLLIVGALYSFRIYIVQMISGVSGVLLYLLFIPVLAIALLQVVELYQNHQRKMNSLNFIE
jgi:hypothetical protein